MSIIFTISIIIFVLSILYHKKNKGKWPLVPLIVFFSVTINFILYLFHWSDAMVEPVYPETYLMITTIQIVFSIYCFLPNQGVKKANFRTRKISLGNFKILPSCLLLVLCLALCIMENFILFGSLIAANSHAHTSAVPILSSVLKGLYPLAGILTFIDYENTKKKSILLLASLVLVYSVIGSQGRFWPICAVLTTVFFMGHKTYKKHGTKAIGWLKNIKLRYKVLGAIGLFYSLGYLINMGASRISMFTYSELLKYTGPGNGKNLGELLSWYYGYFPFSFYNLNTTIHSISQLRNYTYGQFLINPYACFFHVDSLLGIDYTLLNKSIRVVQLNVATVATGYYEFFSDFGYFFVIGILVFVIYTRYFEKKKTFLGIACYSYMLLVWVMMSFLNVYTVGIFIYFFVFAFIANKWIVIQKSDE